MYVIAAFTRFRTRLHSATT